MTAAQLKVMKWLGYGWTSEPGAGSAIMVNGQRICNLSTMKALEHAGFVEVDAQHCWKATAAGVAETGRLCL